MAERFTDIVYDVASQFVNSVLFIDERAFTNVSTNPSRDFDAKAVAQAFAEAGKVCSFYAPSCPDDVAACKKLVAETDIVVLDWDLYIPVTSSGEDDETQDVESDNRGFYSLQLIKSIADDAESDKLRVVFIYTGETDIDEVADRIIVTLNDSKFKRNNSYEIHSDNIHIIIRLKEQVKTEYTGNSKYVVKYSELPKVVISSFSDYVRGLMPCFAMKSLTAIRDRAACILKTYNANLDPEYLGHQMALSDPNDSKLFIANSFGAGLSELIMDDSSIDIDSWVEAWIEDNFREERTTTFMTKSFAISDVSLKKFFNGRHSSTSLFKRIIQGFGVSFNNMEKANTEIRNDGIVNLSSLFCPGGTVENDSRHQFAALSHNKNVFSSRKKSHPLTLGTILKEDASDNYFLCIQQRCDTARVQDSGMDFMFLPMLSDCKQPISAISIGPAQVLYISKSSKNACQIHFRPGKPNGMVMSREVDGKELFSSEKKNKEYIWVGEIKEMFAQRIVASYVSQFSRVGIDETEWLRIKGTSN